MATSSPDLRDIRAIAERAIHAAIAGTMTIDVAITTAITAVMAAAAERNAIITPAERTADELARLLSLWQAAGANRDAASKVARSLSQCPQQQEILAQRIRRLVRRNRD